MIKRQEKLVITFYTTTDAMAAEQLCKERQAVAEGKEAHNS